MARQVSSIFLVFIVLGNYMQVITILNDNQFIDAISVPRVARQAGYYHYSLVF